MHPYINELRKTHDLSEDICQSAFKLLMTYEKNTTAQHSIEVAAEAKLLAQTFGEDGQRAEIAGALHDISDVIPREKRLEIAECYRIEILPEERRFPLILHQKLSGLIAHQIFKIEDEELLAAISCHTTLRANPSKLDMILFISDKIKWDQKDRPSYIREMNKELEKSLEAAAYAFIKHQLENSAKLMVVHPWLVEAYDYLQQFI